MTSPWKIDEGLVARSATGCFPRTPIDRPASASVDLLVIHNISLPPGEFGGDHIEALFTNTLDPTAHAYFAEIAHLNVSAHFLVRRDGELVPVCPRPMPVLGTPVNPPGANAPTAMTSRWGSKWRGRTISPTKTVQYQALRRLVGALREVLSRPWRQMLWWAHSEICPGPKN